ncbi:hypothetical protein [Thiorhodococcus minor]|uniref:hypothetical protein n=1 Tax=Thiorhodococcus minor TaxID=57489 RepID=UPI003CC91CF2
MGIAGTERLAERLAQADHLGLARPVEARQGLMGIQGILIQQTRHARPVEVPNVLAPAEDLADEALHGVERRPARVEGRNGGVQDLTRVEQLQVERGRELRMVEPGLADPHGVLVVAKTRETQVDEVSERLQGLLARDWPSEGVKIARVVREAPLDKLQDLARQGIRREAATPGQDAWT